MLPAAKSAALDAWRAERMLAEDDAVPWMTIGKALRDTDDFLANATGDEAALLGEVKNYLYDLAERAMSPSLLKFAGQASLVDEAMLPS